MSASKMFAGLLGAALASIVSAQTPTLAPAPALPHTPDGCLAALVPVRKAAYAKVADTTLTPRYTMSDALRASHDFARFCAAQFDVATVPDSALITLVTLYRSVPGDTVYTAKVHQALQRALANRGVSPAEHLKRLSAAIGVFADEKGQLSQVQALTQEVDHSPVATAGDKFRAHASLMQAYAYAKMYPQVIAEAIGLDALGPSLDSAAAAQFRLGRGPDAKVLQDQAGAYVAMGRNDKAVAVYTAKAAQLEHASVMTAADSQAIVSLTRYARHYALVGALAPTIVAQRWFNAAEGMTQYVPKGKVSLIMYTAHWCGPCKASYPTIARLADLYRPKGVETVIEMKTYGYFAGQHDLTPAQEAELDRKFYVDDFKFHMPIAIFEAMVPKGAEPGTRGGDPNEEAYGLLAYPTYVIVGRDGIVRRMFSGWSGKSSEQQLSEALDEALAGS